MTTYQIFIAHCSIDEPFAIRLRNCLSNIVEFEPYLAQDYPSFGDSFKDRIMNAIENCSVFICCLSKSALNNQWVNQELGYASAVKKRKSNYQIIPLSEDGLDLKGMITSDSEDILFMDKYGDDEFLANIILSIRNKIWRGHNYGALHFRVKCKHCVDTIKLPREYNVALPEHNILRRAIDEGSTWWQTECPVCSGRNCSSIFTWGYVDG